MDSVMWNGGGNWNPRNVRIVDSRLDKVIYVQGLRSPLDGWERLGTFDSLVKARLFVEDLVNPKIIPY